MKVHNSALKHGVRAEDAVRLRLGFDMHGRLIETVVPTFDSGKELVIHAITTVTDVT